MAESEQPSGWPTTGQYSHFAIGFGFYYIGSRHSQAFGKVYKVSGGN